MSTAAANIENLQIHQSINPMEMVAAAAEQQEQFGTQTTRELFVNGNLVECEVQGQTIVGRVICTDDDLLYLEKWEDGKRRLHMINTTYLSSFKTLDDGNSEKLTVTEEDFDTNAAIERVKQKIEQFKEISVQDASLTGIETFATLRKLYHNVKWRGKAIVVFGFIVVDEPYGQENVSSTKTDFGTQSAMKQIRNTLLAVPSFVEQRKQQLEERGFNIPTI